MLSYYTIQPTDRSTDVPLKEMESFCRKVGWLDVCVCDQGKTGNFPNVCLLSFSPSKTGLFSLTPMPLMERQGYL